MVNDTGSLGRVAMKPTQAMEDGINAGLHSWLLQGTKFTVGRKYAVDGYVSIIGVLVLWWVAGRLTGAHATKNDRATHLRVAR